LDVQEKGVSEASDTTDFHEDVQFYQLCKKRQLSAAYTNTSDDNNVLVNPETGRIAFC